MNHDKQYSAAIERLRSPKRLELLEVERVVDYTLEDIIAQTLLDVGTGSGVFAEAFSAAGLAVTGIDTNQEMLEVARQFVSTRLFEQAPAEAIPFPDDSFDIAFMGHVLHESTEPLAVLREARRVARQRVVVLEWPWREETMGPPLAHRFQPEQVARLAQDAELIGVESADHAYMTVYRLQV